MSESDKVPAISVVMSAFNAEPYLEEAILSIQNQTFQDFELIIINDGSTDATGEIIQTYASLDSRIIVITQKNKGLIKSLNTGFRIAKGAYIARMDADDISLPYRLQKQYDYLQSNKKLVLLGSLVAFIDEDSHINGIWPFLYEDEEIRNGMISHAQYCHGAVMIRRSAIDAEPKQYDLTAQHHEDYEYWPRLLTHGKGANLPEILYYYRQSSTSITATMKPEMERGSQQIRARELKRLDVKSFRLKDCWNTFSRAYRTYTPTHMILGDRKFATKLRYNYQSYLIGISNLYIIKRKFGSALMVMCTGFLINPLRFTNLVIDKVRHAYSS